MAQSRQLEIILMQVKTTQYYRADSVMHTYTIQSLEFTTYGYMDL